MLAAEIAAARPDLIALQEVALWRHGPIELDQIGRPNATEVDFDFLATLLADLQARGVGYDVVQQQQGSDVEAPAFARDPADGGARDVRLTLQDVILLRQDSPVRVSGRGGAEFGSGSTSISAEPPSPSSTGTPGPMSRSAGTGCDLSPPIWNPSPPTWRWRRPRNCSLDPPR